MTDLTKYSYTTMNGDDYEGVIARLETGEWKTVFCRPKSKPDKGGLSWSRYWSGSSKYSSLGEFTRLCRRQDFTPLTDEEMKEIIMDLL